MTDTTDSADGAGVAGEWGGAGGRVPLRRAVITGIELLCDLRNPPAAVSFGRLEQLLRLAVERHTSSTETPVDPGRTAAAAGRTACSHLRAAELEDAYLALISARDLLR